MATANLSHPQRVPLAAEVHSRPFLRLEGAQSLTHLAVYARPELQGKNDAPSFQHTTLVAFCQHFAVTAPAPEAKYFYHDFGRFRLKWECHTEFATFTFAARDEVKPVDAKLFDRVPLRDLPQDWLRGLEGKIMVAAHVVLQPADSSTDPFEASMQRVFGANMLVGSQVLQGAEICTDFLIHADGFSRFVVRDLALHHQQSGRLVQRLLEIETYRMMALLGLPYAQQATPILNGIEAELATLTVAMVDQHRERADLATHDADEEQALLRQITELAARVERLSLDNSYRFAAAQAYFNLVHTRIEELREVQIGGVPTVGEFMERRLQPAMNTCTATARRQQALAARIANTNDLLRTRVGIVQEQQNRKILQSMNARVAQQLRLQQAVEGLSVVAITYYLAGLVNYGCKAIKAAGVAMNPELVTGLLVPLIGLGVWMAMQRFHRKMELD